MPPSPETAPTPCLRSFADRLGPADADETTSWCFIRGVALKGHVTPTGHLAPTEAVGAATTAHWIQVGAFYVPLVIAFAFNLGTYMRVGNAFRQLHRDGAVEGSKERLVQLRLRLHLSVFVVVWAVPVVHRTLQIWSVDSYALRVLHAATECSLGWLNCIVYGCNDKTLRPYKEACRQIRSSLRGSRSGVQIGVTSCGQTSTLLSGARGGFAPPKAPIGSRSHSSTDSRRRLARSSTDPLCTLYLTSSHCPHRAHSSRLLRHSGLDDSLRSPESTLFSPRASTMNDVRG